LEGDARASLRGEDVCSTAANDGVGALGERPQPRPRERKRPCHVMADAACAWPPSPPGLCGWSTGRRARWAVRQPTAPAAHAGRRSDGISHERRANTRPQLRCPQLRCPGPLLVDTDLSTRPQLRCFARAKKQHIHHSFEKASDANYATTTARPRSPVACQACRSRHHCAVQARLRCALVFRRTRANAGIHFARRK